MQILKWERECADIKVGERECADINLSSHSQYSQKGSTAN